MKILDAGYYTAQGESQGVVCHMLAHVHPQQRTPPHTRPLPPTRPPLLHMSSPITHVLSSTCTSQLTRTVLNGKLIAFHAMVS